MKLALYSRKLKEQHLEFYTQILNYFEANGHQISVNVDISGHCLFENYQISTFETRQDLEDFGPKALICLGGDGTILDTVVLTKGTQIPVLGVNMGRLGFLANTNLDSFYGMMDRISRDAYKIEERMLLECNSNIPIFINENVALNDLTFLRTNTSSMIEVSVYVNGEFLNSYFADGLIVATSTGSTGYSLSCGGPILHPNTNSFVLTPIAPHNLNIRPIVLPDSVIISFKVRGRTPEFLCTLDSRHTHITEQHIVSVQKACSTFKIIQTQDNYFLEALKNKLNWGS